MNAAVISRVLHKAGFVITATYAREGVRVRKGWGGCVVVVAQIDDEGRARRIAAEAAQVLRGAGYAVEPYGEGLRVSDLKREKL